MSNSAPTPPWAVDLREYIERIFEERQRAMELAWAVQQKAADYAMRVYEDRHRIVLDRITDLEEYRAQNMGRRGGAVETRTLVFATLGVLVGIAGVIVAVVSFVSY